jgi:hypothetical protein
MKLARSIEMTLCSSMIKFKNASSTGIREGWFRNDRAFKPEKNTCKICKNEKQADEKPEIMLTRVSLKAPFTFCSCRIYSIADF